MFRFFVFLSTLNDVRTDLVLDQQQISCAKKSVRILTLTTSAHFFVAVVSMSVRSVGGEEIQVFSPVGNTRAEAIPAGVPWKLER